MAVAHSYCYELLLQQNEVVDIIAGVFNLLIISILIINFKGIYNYYCEKYNYCHFYIVNLE